MFKTREGGGGQGPFKQFLKKLHNWLGMASLSQMRTSALGPKLKMKINWWIYRDNDDDDDLTKLPSFVVGQCPIFLTTSRH